MTKTGKYSRRSYHRHYYIPNTPNWHSAYKQVASQTRAIYFDIISFFGKEKKNLIRKDLCFGRPPGRARHRKNNQSLEGDCCNGIAWVVVEVAAGGGDAKRFSFATLCIYDNGACLVPENDTGHCGEAFVSCTLEISITGPRAWMKVVKVSESFSFHWKFNNDIFTFLR